MLKHFAYKCNRGNYFNYNVSGAVDKKILNSLKLLNEDRRQILNWPITDVLSSVHLTEILLTTKLRSFLNQLGTLSLSYLRIHGRINHPCVNDVTSRELDSVLRFVKYPQLRQLLPRLLANPVRLNAAVTPANVYPIKRRVISDLTKLSSKAFREARNDAEAHQISVYKLGPILNPGELKAWTRSLKKLTSTRHKNILLRAMHGDIFSNSRLFKFRLRDSPACLNCNEPMDTIQHRLIECPKARESWLKLNEAKLFLSLNPLLELSLENIIGAKDLRKQYQTLR